jgi:hypothetical protein
MKGEIAKQGCSSEEDLVSAVRSFRHNNSKLLRQLVEAGALSGLPEYSVRFDDLKTELNYVVMQAGKRQWNLVAASLSVWIACFNMYFPLGIVESETHAVAADIATSMARDLLEHHAKLLPLVMVAAQLQGLP